MLCGIPEDCYSEEVTSSAFGLIGKAGISGFPFRALAHRAALLALISGSEVLLASVMLDGAVLSGSAGGIAGFIGRNGAWIARGFIGFAFLFSAFAVLRFRAGLAVLADRLSETRIDTRFLALHIGAISLFALLSLRLYSSAPDTSPDATAFAWIVVGFSAVIFSALAMAPFSIWVELIRGTRLLILYAATASAITCAVGMLSQQLWERASRFTFALVNLILRFFVENIVVQPAAMRIGTHRFTVVISQQCSGLEGAALILVFGLFWLLLCRRDLRFPQAWSLLPISMAVLFFLNAIRITALILIGHAGARDIATRGFHSQAGWIAFNGVAFALALVSPRLSWFSSKAASASESHQTNEYPAAQYVVPFLVILAAGMISRAASGGFEWAYPLRPAAALAALWHFRRTYRRSDWRFGWIGPAAGLLIFILWTGLDQLTGVDQGLAMPLPLSRATPMLTATWIALRTAAAIVTVPIAEELAFRGFLLRRLISSEFEDVSRRQFTWISILGSSFVFGLLHGDHWLAATASGIICAAVLLRHGRFGDAIAAHATANALIAADVLLFHRWYLWQ